MLLRMLCQQVFVEVARIVRLCSFSASWNASVTKLAMSLTFVSSIHWEMLPNFTLCSPGHWLLQENEHVGLTWYDNSVNFTVVLIPILDTSSLHALVPVPIPVVSVEWRPDLSQIKPHLSTFRNSHIMVWQPHQFWSYETVKSNMFHGFGSCGSIHGAISSDPHNLWHETYIIGCSKNWGF